MTKKSREVSDQAKKRRSDAIEVIKALLKLDIDEKMKQKFLSNCLWQITQAEGKNKYDLRYKTKAALKAIEEGRRKELRHEHVYPRKQMVQKLIGSPENVDEIVKDAVGCVVTEEEHAKLSQIDRDFPDLEGCQRYQEAGIAVFDTNKKPLAKVC